MSGTTVFYNAGTNELPSLEVVIDPLDHYKHVKVVEMQEALGLIPNWFMLSGRHPHLITLSLWDAMDAQYKHGGGLYDMTNTDKHDLREGGVLLYGDYENDPEESDPPLYPLARYTRVQPVENIKEVLYQYQSGIVAIDQPGQGTFRVSRMD